MKTKIVSIAFLSLSCLMFVQCNKTNNVGTSSRPTLPEVADDYHANLPVNARNNTPGDNQITNAGATLGRVLFYDKKLSVNNQTACASCHSQSNAFADPVKFSTGFEGKLTGRNSMSIVNSISANGYFWDNRTAGLEEMVLQPVQHKVEMGMEKMEILPMKLANIDYYPSLFEKAFGSKDITADRISKAMAQFLRSMTCYDSKADQTNLFNGTFGGWGNSTDPRVTPQENHGALLFQQSGCTNCHSGENLRGWNDGDSANIGLEMVYTDKGMGVTNSNLEGVFRIPSLRNVAKTAPYMHDGRFATLRDVLHHYNANVVDHPNLDTRLRMNPWGAPGSNPPRKLNLSETDIDDIIAFLGTLTDENLISDPKFSNPFK